MKLDNIKEGGVYIVKEFASSLHNFEPGTEVKVRKIQGPSTIVCFGVTKDGALNYQNLLPEQLKMKIWDGLSGAGIKPM